MKPPWASAIDYNQKPIFVCWETTKSCLLSCRHCRAAAIHSRLPGEMDCSESRAFIDQLVQFDEPYPALLLTGGDPLMREDFFDLLKHAKARGVYTAVAASVTPLLTRDHLARMKDLGVDIISVSLDGATAEVHDRIREIPGTWQATLDAISTATSCGLRLQVNTTVMRSNLRQLADIFVLSRERGAVAWEVFFLIRTGRGAALENPEPAECEEVAHFLFEATRYGIPVRTSEGPHFRRVVRQRQAGGGAPQGELYERLVSRLGERAGAPQNPPGIRLNATGDGKGIIFIGYDGEVYPSGFLPISLGNVRTGNLKSIYTSHPLLVGLRNTENLKGRCGACDYRSICSGSRSRAYAEFHDPYQEDPACPYIPPTEAGLPT